MTPTGASRRGARAILPAATVAALACVVVAATGCTSSSEVVGTWWQIPLTKITFPVLWAGTNPDGTPAAGIEPAGIEVQTAADPSFTVDLEGIRAKGAGPQWQASTASAATVATLFTGSDPSSISVGYSITAPIDGPSGGAALTVGTIAAIRGDRVRPKVVMTGTIAPDGTIGQVGLVPQKLRAAAKAGYRTVLVPVGNRTAFDEATGRPVDVIALGRTLGLRVQPIRDINDAYEVFTGQTIAPPVARPAHLQPEALVVARRTTRESLAAARGDLARSRADLTRDEVTRFTAQLAQAQAAFDAGQLGTAYGLMVDVTYRIGRAAARARTMRQGRTEGVVAVREDLGAEVSRLLAEATAAVDRQSDPTGLGTEQWLTLPSAMGWVVYAQAVLTTLDNALKAPPTIPDEKQRLRRLADLAAVVEDERVSIRRFGPDAVAVVRASPSRNSVDQDQAAEFMSGYTTFLVRAGNDNLALYQATGNTSAAAVDATEIYGPFNALSKEIATTSPDVNSLRDEIRQSANAITYFVLGTTLVSGNAFGLSGFGLGEDVSPAFQPVLLRNAVETGAENVRGWSGFLQWDGNNMSYPTWQEQWASGVYTALRGTRREESAATIALNELWYAVINDLVMRSATLHLG